MKPIANALTAALILALSQAPALAQQDRSAVRPSRQSVRISPATQPVRNQSSVQPPVITDVNVVVEELNIDPSSVKLKDFLPMLQQKVREFQFVTEPGPWEDLMLPELHLRN